jgi:hypothetical protein
MEVTQPNPTILARTMALRAAEGYGIDTYLARGKHEPHGDFGADNDVM